MKSFRAYRILVLLFQAVPIRIAMPLAPPILNENIMDEAKYRNFLYFAVALCILLQKNISLQLIEKARIFLKMFVVDCALLYGTAFISYNIHSFAR